LVLLSKITVSTIIKTFPVTMHFLNIMHRIGRVYHLKLVGWTSLSPSVGEKQEALGNYHVTQYHRDN
jgi:hypothetical protein